MVRGTDDYGDPIITYSSIAEAKVDLYYVEVTIYWLDDDGVRLWDSAAAMSDLRAGGRWRIEVTYSKWDESDPKVEDIADYEVWASWELA